jgi:hypothetical protein
VTAWPSEASVRAPRILSVEALYCSHVFTKS